MVYQLVCCVGSTYLNGPSALQSSHRFGQKPTSSTASCGGTRLPAVSKPKCTCSGVYYSIVERGAVEKFEAELTPTCRLRERSGQHLLRLSLLLYLTGQRILHQRSPATSCLQSPFYLFFLSFFFWPHFIFSFLSSSCYHHDG